MMDMNGKDVNLGLALGSTNYSIRTRLNNSSGAGVNADSRMNLAFATSDALSELVWSPNNGLSLKCANSSAADKKPFLLWNVGPSSKGLSPSQIIGPMGSIDDNAVDQRNLTISPTVLDADDIFVNKATLLKPSENCHTPELDATESNRILEEEAGNKAAIQEEENRIDDGEEDLCRPQNVQSAGIAEISKENAGLSSLADGISDHKADMKMKGLFSTELIRKTHCSQNTNIETHARSSDINRFKLLETKLPEALVQSLPNLQPQKEPDDEVTSATGAMNKNKIMPISNPAPPLQKLESSAENDLCQPTEKDACSFEGMKLPAKSSPPFESSPSNSRICLYQEKGKEKALSDGDIYGRSSDDEDESHESVESCNSAGLFSKGIKRQSYDKWVILGSKRMKKQIHGSSGSTSVIRPDSSFLNWISNMVKGLSDCNKEDFSSSPVLNLACSGDVDGKTHQENLICNKTQDSANLNMGFQNIFQSLYCRDTDVLDTGVQKENDSIEKSRELMLTDKTSFENLPGSCGRNYDNSSKQIIVSNKEVYPVIAGQPSKPFMLSADIDCSPHPCESNLAENKASENLVSNRAKDGAIPSDSLGEQMNITAEKTTPDIPVAMSAVPERSNPLTSLWITRLSSKAPRLEKCDEITGETIECSTYCHKVDLDNRVNDIFLIDQKSSEATDSSADSQVYASIKEIQKFTTNTEALVDLKSKGKLCPILPSHKYRSSEAMASVFARRLDALRHITPPKKRNSSTCSVTCFFCGGCHDLRECPDVTKTELEDLLVKMSSFHRVEESSCMCIRCFRLDHWAISCPLAPSSRNWMSEQKASVVNQYTACSLQLYAGNEKCLSYHGGEEDHKLVAADRTACSNRKPFLGSFPTYQTWNVQMSSSKRVSTSDEMRSSTASNLANDAKDNKKSPLCDIVTAQNTVALSEIFHAIRNLRLSRADILRWLNSNVSSSHLNGFFLRLRLGKLEAGLGGTSYYVACITGDAVEHNGCKKSILVDVGGIKSSVASQYVSNHDFLEDEIKAWWCRILDSGCKIPSLDELNSKFNDRKSLGF